MKKNKLQRPPSLFYFRGNTDVILFLLQKELKGGKVSQLCVPLGINSEFFLSQFGQLDTVINGLALQIRLFYELV